MAVDNRAPSRPAQPRSKSSIRSDTKEETSTKLRSDNHSDPQRKVRKQTSNASEDEATAAFVKRVLRAHQLHNSTTGDNGKAGITTSQPLEELLPPLTSSNEVDLQLYALISIIVKDFVQSWYSRITPDHEFVDEVIHIFAHCTRELEQRLRRVDLETLLLDEIPDLLDSHVKAYRTAHDRHSLEPLGANSRHIYHTLQPHPALSPVPDIAVHFAAEDQAENEAAWRHLLVSGVLSLLLPPEDLQNPCLRTLVGEILSEMIIGNGLGGKACEGWLIWDGLTKIIGAVSTVNDIAVDRIASPTTTNRLEQFGLLSAQADSRSTQTLTPRRNISDIIVQAVWKLVSIGSIIFSTLRLAILTFARSNSLPSRPDQAQLVQPVNVHLSDNDESSAPTIINGSVHVRPKRPILEMSALSSPVRFLLLDVRMPWLTGSLSMVQTILVYSFGAAGCTNGRLDRLLSHYIHTYVMNPQLLPTTLLTIRAALFPNNSLGPARPIPSPGEESVIKRSCAEAIVDSIPDYVRQVYFGTKDKEDMHCQTEQILDVFGDSYLNKHLIFAIVDHVVCRLFPEMEHVGVESQLREKLA